MESATHAQTPLRQALVERLRMTQDDATWWDDATSWAMETRPEVDTDLRFTMVEDWLRHFPPDTAKGWYLSMATVQDALEWEAAGFTPVQVDEVLAHLCAQCSGEGPGVYESLRREEAWRTSGLGPGDVLSRLRRGQEYPE